MGLQLGGMMGFQLGGMMGFQLGGMMVFQLRVMDHSTPQLRALNCGPF